MIWKHPRTQTNMPSSPILKKEGVTTRIAAFKPTADAEISVMTIKTDQSCFEHFNFPLPDIQFEMYHGVHQGKSGSLHCTGKFYKLLKKSSTLQPIVYVYMIAKQPKAHRSPLLPGVSYYRCLLPHYNFRLSS